MANNDSQAKIIISQLAKTPGFQNLPPESRNRLINRAIQDKFGTIQKSGNVLQNAIQAQSGQRYSPFETAISGSVGGPMMAAGGVTHAEDAAVPATQLVSDLGLDASGIGFIPGVKPAITTALTTAAEGARQGVKSLRGEGFDSGQIKKTAAITGATELASRGIGKLFAGKAASREAVKKGVGELAKMKGALATAGDASAPVVDASTGQIMNDTLHIPKHDLLDQMTQEYAKTKNPSGPAKQVFEKWIEILSDPKVTHVDPRMAMEIQSDFGNAAKFMSEGNWIDKLVGQLGNVIKKPGLNQSAKAVRTTASDMTKGMAGKAGISGFGDASNAFSEAKYDLANTGKDWLGKITRLGEIPVASYAGHAFGLHPAVGAIGGILDLIRRSPAAQDAIYKLTSKGGGAAATTGISELLRRNS